MTDAGHVLVADADLRLRAELGVALTVIGHVVADAGTARDAAAILRARRPDVLVLDVSEGFRGLALLRTLRDEVPAPHPAIVALAPPDDPVAVAEAMLLGVEAQLMRPIDVDTLVNAVEHCLLLLHTAA